MTYDLLVVGAGFAGLACARKAALSGLRVVLLEKKHEAGARLHTTGMFVKDAVDAFAWLRDVPGDLVRPIEGVKLYAPKLSHVTLRAPGYYFWATDTVRLLDWMAGQARTAGAHLRFGTLFTQARRAAAGDAWEVTLDSGEVLHGLHRLGLHGVGATQVGMARTVTPELRQGRVDIEEFLRKTSSIVRPEGRPEAIRAGMIPCGGLLPRIARPGALLIGDAAGLVSPATAGGIHAALSCGETAADAVAAFSRGEAPDPAEWLPAQFPRFRAKRALRRFFEVTQSDWLYDRLLGTRPMRRVAEWVYFHAKGSNAPASLGGGRA